MISHDLIIRFDEQGECLAFFTAKRSAIDSELFKAGTKADDIFSVKIGLSQLVAVGGDEAERMVGKSILGFFDQLTSGKLNLPRHYE